MWIEIVSILSASIFLVLSLALLAFTIKYLYDKPPATQTSFDVVIIDTLWSLFFALIILNIIFICGLLPNYLSLHFVIGLTLVSFISFNDFFISCFLTLCVKIAFIKFSSQMFEVDNFQVRMAVILCRIGLWSFGHCLNIIGPFQADFFPIHLIMGPSDELSRLDLIIINMGHHFNFKILCISAHFSCKTGLDSSSYISSFSSPSSTQNTCLALPMLRMKNVKKPQLHFCASLVLFPFF